MSEKNFKDHIYRMIQNSFLTQEGWRIDSIAHTEGQPLYKVYKKNETIIVSGIDKRALMYSDLDPIMDYRRKYDATRAIIYVPNDTSVTHSIKRHAHVYGVEIQRTPWRGKNQQD